MSLFDQLQDDMKISMKSGDKFRLSTIRMLISSIKYSAIDDRDATSDEKVVENLRHEAKKRKESIEAFHNAGRKDQEEQEKHELEIIESYLPKMMNEEGVSEKVSEILSNNNFDSYGEAMGFIMAQLKGKAEGGLVSQIVKQKFEK